MKKEPPEESTVPESGSGYKSLEEDEELNPFFYRENLFWSNVTLIPTSEISVCLDTSFGSRR